MKPAAATTDRLDTSSPSRAAEALLARLDIIDDVQQEAALLHLLAQPQRPTVVSFLNQHGFNLAWRDPRFLDSLMTSGVLLRDGVGLSVCLKWLGRTPGLNMNGTDLIPRIAHSYAGRSVMLIGTVAPYLDRAADVLSAKQCRIVGALNGFLPDASYVEAVRTHRPELVILGMGMPRQEQVAALLAREVDYPALIVNGGAIIDFLGGRVRRAPLWIRRARMEWAFRLLQEPRRMFNRYILGGFTFVGRIGRLRLAQRSMHDVSGSSHKIEKKGKI